MVQRPKINSIMYWQEVPSWDLSWDWLLLSKNKILFRVKLKIKIESVTWFLKVPPQISGISKVYSDQPDTHGPVQLSPLNTRLSD